MSNERRPMNANQLAAWQDFMKAAENRLTERIDIGLTAGELASIVTALCVAEDAMTFIETGVVSDYLRERLDDTGAPGLNDGLRRDWEELRARLFRAERRHPAVIASRQAYARVREHEDD